MRPTAPVPPSLGVNLAPAPPFLVSPVDVDGRFQRCAPSQTQGWRQARESLAYIILRKSGYIEESATLSIVRLERVSGASVVLKSDVSLAWRLHRRLAGQMWTPRRQHQGPEDRVGTGHVSEEPRRGAS